MLIKVKKEVEEMVEIKLPLYFKTDWQYFAWMNEKELITIHLNSDGRGGLVCHGSPLETEIRKAQTSEEITAEVFQFAFEMAIDRLRKSFIPVTEKEIV